MWTKQRNSIQEGLTRALRKPTRTSVTKGGIGDQPLPDAGYVRFRAVSHPDLGLVAELNGPVTPAGYGQHETVAREGRVGLNRYTGREPLTLRIPLLLDRWKEQRSVETEVRVLERMHGLDDHLPGPPRIIVEGIGIPHSYSRDPSLRWVMTGDPEWDDEGSRTVGRDGHRGYVPVAITVKQDERPTTLVAPAKDDDKSPRHSVTIEKGSSVNTLREIAKRRHMDWHKLRALNPRLPGDPDNKLKPGTHVRVS